MKFAILGAFCSFIAIAAVQPVQALNVQPETRKAPLSRCRSDDLIKCRSECPLGKDENGCDACVCLPPTDKKCPRLLKCRDGCTVGLTSYSGGCPACLNCPDTPNHCPTFRCIGGSILGNPDDKGCDVCVTPPAADVGSSRHRRDEPYRRKPCGAFIVCKPECHFIQESNKDCPTCVCDTPAKPNRQNY